MTFSSKDNNTSVTDTINYYSRHGCFMNTSVAMHGNPDVHHTTAVHFLSATIHQFVLRLLWLRTIWLLSLLVS